MAKKKNNYFPQKLLVTKETEVGVRGGTYFDIHECPEDIAVPGETRLAAEYQLVKVVTITAGVKVD